MRHGEQADSAASSKLREQLIAQGIITPVLESRQREPKTPVHKAGKKAGNSHAEMRTCAICDQPYTLGDFEKHLETVCRREAAKSVETPTEGKTVKKPKGRKRSIPIPVAKESKEILQRLDSLFNVVSQRKLERRMEKTGTKEQGA
ncbi:MAG TPA: hypothetical protein VMU57_09045 [Edaphobacter sp.]|uniref:hypothetical protein n=1 Tax=Edaphobacter sp. TaxID=1934404 RepID=UPI002B95B34E|nr:hypothetical protein [Edaphobacter sp.]HUZ95046.1 hypothetical protein [Edaphobacter sp.]